MIKHLVLFKWKQNASDEQIAAVTTGLAKLKADVPEIISYDFGPDARIYKGNADYCLIAEFASEQDFKVYVTHKSHLDFMNEVLSPIMESFTTAQFIFEK